MISWALVVAAPVLLPVVVLAGSGTQLSASFAGWLSFGYLSFISMLFAFFAWYRGLAIGGVARISQIQLLQPILTLIWSAVLLAERFGVATVGAAALVLASVFASQRARVVSSAPETQPATLPRCAFAQPLPSKGERTYVEEGGVRQ